MRFAWGIIYLWEVYMPIGKKQQLKSQHEKKLMELYESYYKKALGGDTASFKAFIDVSKELFADKEEDSLMKLLEDAKTDE